MVITLNKMDKSSIGVQDIKEGKEATATWHHHIIVAKMDDQKRTPRKLRDKKTMYEENNA